MTRLFLIITSEEDRLATVQLLCDLANMTVVDLKIKIGSGDTAYSYRKPILVDKDTGLSDVCEQLTALVKLPKEAQLRVDYTTIIYSLIDNRKLMDTRLDFIVVTMVNNFISEERKKTILFSTSKIIPRMMIWLVRQYCLPEMLMWNSTPVPESEKLWPISN